MLFWLAMIAFMAVCFSVAVGEATKKPRRRQRARRRSRAHAKRQDAIADRPSTGPCRVCGDVANEAGHECEAQWTVVSQSYRDRSGGMIRFRHRHHSVVTLPDGSNTRCPHRHQQVSAAERCGRLSLRRMQLAERPSTIPGLTDAAWKRMMQEAGYTCRYCTKRFPAAELEREHAIPLIRGGANHASNIVVACRPCNRLKGTMTDVEFLRTKPWTRSRRL